MHGEISNLHVHHIGIGLNYSVSTVERGLECDVRLDTSEYRFFKAHRGILKSELLYLKEFDSIEQFKQELIEYLDYYNNRRIKAKLKGLPPAVHRKQALDAA